MVFNKQTTLSRLKTLLLELNNNETNVFNDTLHHNSVLPSLYFESNHTIFELTEHILKCLHDVNVELHDVKTVHQMTAVS